MFDWRLSFIRNFDNLLNAHYADCMLKNKYIQNLYLALLIYLIDNSKNMAKMAIYTRRILGFWIG